MNRRLHRNCNEKDLLLFHYGELDTVAGQRMQQHLQDCPDCRIRLAALRQQLADIPLPEIVLSDVDRHRMAAIITDRATHRTRPKRWMWGSALAAGAVLAASLFIIPGGLVTLPGSLPRSETEIGMLQDLELLQNIDLLENMELLQDLERIG